MPADKYVAHELKGCIAWYEEIAYMNTNAAEKNAFSASADKHRSIGMLSQRAIRKGPSLHLELLFGAKLWFSFRNKDVL